MLIAVPVTLKQANDFVAAFHRHNKPTQRDAGKFAIACSDGNQLAGVAIVGRPLARVLDDGWTAEVTRVCVGPGAPRNANSFLYARCWNAWRAMGGHRMVTYTLQSESGASLRGAGWRVVAELKPRSEGAWGAAGRYREWQSIYGQQKLRWEVAV